MYLNDLHLGGRKRTCADQLTATIFCRRSPGHIGPHMHQWRETDPIAMWGEQRPVAKTKA